jgi:guanidinoacetate N-methyltransferase
MNLPTANQYITDFNGDECIVDAKGFQVMMAWEKPYMEALIDNMQPTGDVLEIGFGFGYSASQIMKYPIKSYTVIECDQNGIKAAKEWAKKQSHPVKIIEGFWQVEIQKIKETFDAIFFDDSPRWESKELEPTLVMQNTFYEYCLRRCANKNCKVSFYCQLPPWWYVHPAIKYSCKTMSMDIPDSCIYFSDKMKRNKTMFLPLLEYPYGALDANQMDLYSL